MSPAGELLRLLASLLGGMVLSDLCPSEIAVIRRETAQSLGLLFQPIAQFLPNKSAGLQYHQLSVYRAGLLLKCFNNFSFNFPNFISLL